MNKPKSKGGAPQVARPRLGESVIVRAPFFSSVAVGLVVGLYESDTSDVIVQAFPIGRDSLQINAIQYFDSDPGVAVRSAVWPA